MRVYSADGEAGRVDDALYAVTCEGSERMEIFRTECLGTSYIFRVESWHRECTYLQF